MEKCGVADNINITNIFILVSLLIDSNARFSKYLIFTKTINQNQTVLEMINSFIIRKQIMNNMECNVSVQILQLDCNISVTIIQNKIDITYYN